MHKKFIKIQYSRIFINGVIILGKRKPYFYEALISILGLILVMAISLVKFKTDPHIPMLLGSALAGLVAYKVGYDCNPLSF